MLTGGVHDFKRLARIVIAIFKGTFKQFNGNSWGIGGDGEDHSLAVFPARCLDQREMAASPDQVAKSDWQVGEFAGRAIERGVQEEQRVADGNILAGIAAISGFDPGNCRGGVAAPVKLTRARPRLRRECWGWCLRAVCRPTVYWRRSPD